MASATRSVEVFRAGTFVPMEGAAITFSPSDLAQMASVYDAENAPAPAVVGHPKTDTPAYGWAKSFAVNSNGILVAEVGDILPAFAEAVENRTYRKISLSLFSPDAPNNPKPGCWYPKHIGFLGGAAPSVTGLAPVSFAAAPEGVVTVEFSDAGMKETAGVLRSLREWIISKFGIEEADRAISGFSINWIDDAADADDDDGPRFSSPQETSMTDKKPAAAGDMAARAAELDAREQRLKAQEDQARHAANVSFADSLVADGKLLPVLKDKTVALLDVLAATPNEVSFAEGTTTVKASPTRLMQDILSAAPRVVDFSDVSGSHGTPPRGGVVEFATPSGMQADPASADLHARAIAWQSAHPGSDYMAAVAAVNR